MVIYGTEVFFPPEINILAVINLLSMMNKKKINLSLVCATLDYTYECKMGVLNFVTADWLMSLCYCEIPIKIAIMIYSFTLSFF